MKWQPVEIHIFGNYRNWSYEGIHCFLTNKDCETCPARFYGLTQFKGCKQPQAVQILLERTGPPPEHKVRYYHQRKAPVI